MKKIALFRKYGESAEFVARFDSVEEASDQVKDIINEDEDANVFDFYTEEQEYTDIRDRVKTYEDACKVLGVEPINEQNAKAQGFRSDEIARRKLETIAAALNEGWKPDWNNTDQYKYYPYFYIQENAKGKGSAGLSCAATSSAASTTLAYFGSRLCFYASRLARYAGNQFTDLYEQILIEKL